MAEIESTLKAFYHETMAQAGDGVSLRLVMNFRTIDRLEGLLGLGMDDILSQLSASTSIMGKLVWAMTREHHSEINLDQIAGIMLSPEYGPPFMVVVGDLVRRAFHMGREGEQSSHPPKRSAGASKSSSRNGSPRASARKTSGTKRRARSS